MLTLNALIARTEKALKSEKDPGKLLALAGQLEAYKKTKTHIEKHETEEGEDEGDEEESSPPPPAEDSEESEESEESAEGDETDREEDDPDDQGDDPDDDEDDSDEDESEEEEEASASEEESAKAAASAIVRASGLTSKSARAALRRAAHGMFVKAVRGSQAYKVFQAAAKITRKKSASAIVSALQGHADASRELKSRVATIENDRRNERKAGLIDKAKAQGRITPAEAKLLRSKKLAFVESYLDMRPAAIVHRDPGTSTGTAGHRLPNASRPAAPISAEDPAVKKELRRALGMARLGGLKMTEGDLLSAVQAAGATVTANMKFPEN